MRAAPSAYSRKQIILHWIIAALVAFQIFFSGGIEALWRDRMAGTIPNEPSPNPHTIVGVLILALMLWRVWLRLRRGAPAPPEAEHPALRLAARLTHGAFYVLLIGMPVAGAIAWFGGRALPAQIHGAASTVLIVLILVHVVAALAHQFWFRTEVLSRMKIG